MKTYCIREWRPVSTATPFIFDFSCFLGLASIIFSWCLDFYLLLTLVLGDFCVAKSLQTSKAA
jgi:hypothetical protein